MRIAILDLLRRDGSTDVATLGERLDEPQKRVSYHAGVLERAGYVERDHEGRLRVTSQYR